MSNEAQRSVETRLFCSDPLKQHPNIKRKQHLRKISRIQLEKFKDLGLHEESKLCTQCRKHMATSDSAASGVSPSASYTDQDPSGPSGDHDSSHGADQFEAHHDLAILNESLSLLGGSPVKKRKLSKKRYVLQKVEKTASLLQQKMTKIQSESDVSSESSEETECVDKRASYFDEMITELKAKYKTCTSRSDKIRVLTAAPASWSARKLAGVFGTSVRFALRAKKLRKEKGCLSEPNQKPGKTLSNETAEKVRQFYMRDDVSREMPGKKDFLSVVNDNGKREHMQKRLMLCNLREAHQLFKRENPDVVVGLSKFSELRPAQCILAGPTGTHTVCVCVHHQNVKLMMEGSQLRDLSKEQNVTLDSYRHCLAQVMCNPPSLNCIFRKCKECSGTENLQQLLEKIFEGHMVDKVKYRKWFTTDRSALETIEKSVSDFITDFCDAIEKLAAHDFVAKAQSSFLNHLKNSLTKGEVIVLGDFSENYSFVVQDEVQSYHWSKDQVTLHPFVCYWVENGEPKHTSYVAISECLVHDTAAVHLFQSGMITYLQQKLGCRPKKIYYFSDGCSGQYKNRKNFVNLCHHEMDFGIPAEWHFFATAHGKGPCDGVGGTLKRIVARVSLQRPYEKQIVTPRQFYRYAQENISSIYVQYFTEDEWKVESEKLSDRFDFSKAIAGTQKLHAIRPLGLGEVEVAEFSASDQYRAKSVVKRTAVRR